MSLLPEAPFAVWDADVSLTARPGAISTIHTGSAGLLTAVGLPRGGHFTDGFTDGESVVVWSFNPDVVGEDTDWPLRHAAMACADRRVSTVSTESGKSEIGRIMAAIQGPREETLLVIEDVAVPARLLRFEARGVVVAPTDPAFPVAVSVSSRVVPMLAKADPQDW